MGKTQEMHNESPWAFTFGDRLEKALRVARVTNGQMAETLGVSSNTVGNYIAGRTEPSRLQVKEWALRTGAPLEWLLNGDSGDDRPVGPAGIEPTTSTVECGQFNEVIDIRERKRAQHAMVSAFGQVPA